MTYEVFEGKGVIKKPRRKSDKDFYDEAIKQLNFKSEIDFATLCASIGLFMKNNNKQIELIDDLSLQEMTKMASFQKKELYDLIILSHLEIKEDRLNEFEKYFYAGFLILKEWFEDYGPDMNSEIERFCSIWDYVNKD